MNVSAEHAETSDHRREAEALAAACAGFMLGGDRVGRSFGVKLVAAAPGRASVSLTVTDAMLNGFETLHGAVSFALADIAFSLACNSRNDKAVGQFCSIHYLQAARTGQTLIAEAVECALVGRSGIYDTEVRTAEGEVIAQFRGHSRLLGARVLPD